MAGKNPFALRSKWYRTIHMGSIWYSLAIMDDDELNWRDAPETLALAAGLTWIWWDTAALALAVPITPVIVVEVAVVTGLVASVVIGGVEGGETYIDYITDPIKDPVGFVKDPEKIDALAQAVEIEMALLNPLAWVGGQIGQYAGRELSKYKDELFRNHWLTGPALPF